MANIKTYVPIGDILQAAETILQLSLVPELGIYLPGQIEVYTFLYGYYLFTDIEFTEEEKDNPKETYDKLHLADDYREIKKALQEVESYYTYRAIVADTIKKLEAYQTSAYGILDSLKKDYDNMNLDVEKLKNDIQDRKGIELVDKIVEKLG